MDTTLRTHPVITACIVWLPLLCLISCSSSGSGPIAVGTPGSPTTPTTPDQNQTPTAITSSADGAEAAALVLQSRELVVTGTTLFKNLGFIAKTYMVSAATVTGSGSCKDYGTYDYNSLYNTGSGKYNVVITFSLCREEGFQYDGNYAAYGKADELPVGWPG